MAAGGARVCIVEGDLRRPRLLEYMGLDGSVGLTNVLIGQADLSDSLQRFSDAGLFVLGAGPIPPNPSELLGSAAMEKTLRELESRFDIVIIDAPPLLPVPAAAVLSHTAVRPVAVLGAAPVALHPPPPLLPPPHRWGHPAAPVSCVPSWLGWPLVCRRRACLAHSLLQIADAHQRVTARSVIPAPRGRRVRAITDSMVSPPFSGGSTGVVGDRGAGGRCSYVRRPAPAAR